MGKSKLESTYREALGFVKSFLESSTAVQCSQAREKLEEELLKRNKLNRTSMPDLRRKIFCLVGEDRVRG